VILNGVDNSMSWFNMIFLSVGIYGSLALVVQILTYHLMQLLIEKCIKRKQKEEKNGDSEVTRLNHHMIGVNLFWACITLTLTIAGLRFGYITMILLLVSLCTQVLTCTLCKVLPRTSKSISTTS
jgi:hypothetical protein